MKMRSLVPCNGNDVVYTPDALALSIIEHFNPHGLICEPCRGGGAFTQYMPGCDWYEIQEGRDFLQADGQWDWIVTNPPWSKVRPFLAKSMSCAENVVFLCLVNAFFMRARQRDMKEAGFGIKEILFVPTPPKPWPQTGFSLGAIHLQRNYTGPININQL